ncbi:MAG: hypothetical protein ABW221_07350 [Vicinamibacteria bacterium]
MSGPTDPPRCSPEEDVPRLDLFEIFRKVRDEQAARAAAAPPPPKPVVVEAPPFPPPPPLDRDVEAQRLREELAGQVRANVLRLGGAVVKQADSFARAGARLVVDYVEKRSEEEGRLGEERARIVQDESQPFLRRLYNAHRLARQVGGDLETEDSHRPQGGIAPRMRVGPSRGMYTGGAGGERSSRSATSSSVRGRDVSHDADGGQPRPSRDRIEPGLAVTSWDVSTRGLTTLVRSKGPVPLESQHIEGIVAKAERQPVTIYAGVHGGRDGSTKPDSSLYDRDAKFFSGRPNVTVVDASGMTAEQLSARANGTPGVVIVNTCNADAVVK